MKKVLIVLTALALVAGLTGVAMATIVGSKHDFSTIGWAQGQICLPCHTPHHADTSVGNAAPLWNHEVTAASFTLYSSPTLDATDLGQPAGVSKLCLSCHDGTVALDAFGGNSGTMIIGPDYNLGTDLSASHPISFTYDTALATADGGLNDPATASSNVSGSSGTIQDDLLFGNKLECSSCHDVHNQHNLGKLLNVTNSSSALCLTCHDK